MHDVMAGHVGRGAVPGLVTLVSRRGEVHVDAIGMKALGGSVEMRRDTIFRIASKDLTRRPTLLLCYTRLLLTQTLRRHMHDLLGYGPGMEMLALGEKPEGPLNSVTRTSPTGAR